MMFSAAAYCVDTNFRNAGAHRLMRRASAMTSPITRRPNLANRAGASGCLALSKKIGVQAMLMAVTTTISPAEYC